METFDKKIKQIKSRRIPLAIIMLMIAAVIFILAIIELLPKEIEYVEFRKDRKLGNYAKTTVYYLMGPLVQVKDSKDGIISGYYVAVGKENDMFIIRLKEHNIEIPILGKDIDENSIDSLEGRELLGNVQLSSSSLRSALNNSLNNIYNEKIANNNNFEKVFGGYYLDTVIEVENNAKNLFILDIFFIMIVIMCLFINKYIRKNVDRNLNKLKAKGKLEEAIKEFEGEKLISYKKLKVYLSPNYIFSYCVGFDIIAFKDIKQVTVSKKVFGSSNKNKYIIITTKDDIEYYIAPISKKRHKFIFNELLTKIKEKI